jgi:hypothetical protein
MDEVHKSSNTNVVYLSDPVELNWTTLSFMLIMFSVTDILTQASSSDYTSVGLVPALFFVESA